MDNVKITNTPYDDVFRTLLNKCSGSIIQARKKSSSHQMNTF